MSERKVLNKYYPPDFDPSKIPRMKLPKNRQYTVRLMAPFNMRCKTCGEYIYKGKKFNARKEDVENEDYLGIRIYRFYIKCTRCLQEISFKTDPKNTDYEIEAGATRNFMALKLAEEQAQREEEEEKEEEQNNPMKLLENRTKQSKNEIELLESLEELKDLNRRQRSVDYDSMLLAYDTKLTAREREERMQQLDEEYIKTVKFHSSQKRKVIVEEEIVEDKVEEKKIKVEPDCAGETRVTVTEAKSSELKEPVKKSVPVGNTWNKSIGSLSKNKKLTGLVKINKPSSNTEELKTNNIPSSSLSLLGNYSGSDNSDND
uniref:Splicing factor YJU2 n=1 Tax=Photinus pyralis TaxID=7054 RepID=A0A1Y1LGY4_PHOPY